VTEGFAEDPRERLAEEAEAVEAVEADPAPGCT
jgi:hypothetical protein